MMTAIRPLGHVTPSRFTETPKTRDSIVMRRMPLILMLFTLLVPSTLHAQVAAPVETKAVSAPSTTSSLGKEIHWVRNSAEHRACMIQSFKLASMLVEKNSAGLTSGTWTVIVDGDETVLDNSQFQKELGPQKFDLKLWKEWESREEAKAMPGAAGFLHHVHELGGKLAVVSNRSTETQTATEHVFHNLGLEYDLMLNKVDTSFKERRFEAIENGSTSLGPTKIVLYVGDNIQDFPGLRQTIREETDQAFDAFGEKYVILPNPMYGSWERNPEE